MDAAPWTCASDDDSGRCHDERGDAHAKAAESTTSSAGDPNGTNVKVWVYYNPTTEEITLYDTEPPESFGRREYDVGPIELDQDLIRSYATMKEIGTRPTPPSSPR